MIKPEIKPLTGIRAVAAFWVVFHHLKPQIEEAFPWTSRVAGPLLSQGYLGVDLFFILSGFIIYYNYGDSLADFRLKNYGEYLWMRLARLWPVHVTILLIYAVGLIAIRFFGVNPIHQNFYSWIDFAWNILMVHAWSVPISVSWNTPAWSISCEFLVYLLFPLFLLLRLQRAYTVVLFLYVGTLFFGTAAICQGLYDTGGSQYGLIRVLGEFFGGCGLGLIHRLQKVRHYKGSVIVHVTVLALLIAPYTIIPLGLVGYWCVPLLGVIVLELARDQGIIASFLSTKVMLRGGYISYSLYMVHEPCLILMSGARRFLHLPIILTLFVYLLVLIPAALLMFYGVEEPCRKAMRKAYPRHRQQPYPVI